MQARAAVIEKRFGNLNLPARKWLRMVRPYTPRQLPDGPLDGPLETLIETPLDNLLNDSPAPTPS